VTAAVSSMLRFPQGDRRPERIHRTGAEPTLSRPLRRLTETYVYMGFAPFTQVATCVKRKELMHT
jgi:hypothetical protein